MLDLLELLALGVFFTIAGIVTINIVRLHSENHD